MLVDATPLKLLLAVTTAILGMIGVSSAVIGYFARNSRIWERIALFGGGLMLIVPDLMTSAIGFVLLSAIWFIQSRRPDEAKDEVESSAITV